MQEKNLEIEKEIKESLEVLKTCEWVREEFSLGVLGDKRLYLRLLVIASDLVQNPTSPINQACGDWNRAKSTYRFFDNDKVTGDKVLLSHVHKTYQRIEQQTDDVLLLEDTSYLNFSHMKSSNDLGYIGKKNNRNGSIS